MTRIALPEMRKAGYDDRLATGALAAGGSIGILIPPSIILVIYASIAEQSVPKLFAAALLPGLLLTALYMAVAVCIAIAYPHYAPPMAKASARERLRALAGPWQFILLFTVTIGGIYAGIFSPTEAAAIGAFGSIVLGFLGRRLTWAALWRSIETSILTSCLLFMIIIGANLFSSFMVQTQFPTMLADGASAMNLSAPVVMIMIVLAYIVMGCFLEGIGMVLITVPVFLPLVVKFGYDPIWFSILVVIVVEVGPHSSPGRHEPVRDPGAGARREDHQYLPRHRPVPDRAARSHRRPVPVPEPRSMAPATPVSLTAHDKRPDSRNPCEGLRRRPA